VRRFETLLEAAWVNYSYSTVRVASRKLAANGGMSRRRDDVAGGGDDDDDVAGVDALIVAAEEEEEAAAEKNDDDDDDVARIARRFEDRLKVDDSSTGASTDDANDDDRTKKKTLADSSTAVDDDTAPPVLAGTTTTLTKFASELAKTPFANFFERRADLGYFAWKPPPPTSTSSSTMQQRREEERGTNSPKAEAAAAATGRGRGTSRGGGGRESGGRGRGRGRQQEGRGGGRHYYGTNRNDASFASSNDDEPRYTYKSILRVTDAEREIAARIDWTGRPDPLLLPTTAEQAFELPHRFPSLPPRGHVNKFPYGQFDCACLSVASRRLLQRRRLLQKQQDVGGGDDEFGIDFAFGGSTLEMLARRNAKVAPYYATAVKMFPNSSSSQRRTILVVKRSEYLQNYSDFGFQFERLLTGAAAATTTISPEQTEVHANEAAPGSSTSHPSFSSEMVEHLHVMTVGKKFRVLFRAEVDAVKDEEPVEIKASNPSNWGTKVMFQMISSASPVMCHGSTSKTGGRGEIAVTTLTGIDLWSLSEVTEKALSKGQSASDLEQNILDGMEALQMQIMQRCNDGDEQDSHEVFKVTFEKSDTGTEKKLVLVPAKLNAKTALLPSPDVMKELLL